MKSNAERAERKRSSDEPPDVLLVVVDCLRSDHLSRFGYERETTPYLDSVEALAFPKAVTASSWTYPAVASMLTGLYVHEHGAGLSGVERGWGDVQSGDISPIPDDVDTLPEVLRTAGYETICHTAIKTVEMVAGDRFDACDYRNHVRGEELVKEFLASWEEVGSGTDRFGYVHFGDVHGWDVTPEGTGRKHVEEMPFGDVEYLPAPDAVSLDDADARDEYFRKYELLYDTQLRHVDQQIERLLESLDRRGELDDTLVVVVGDHGEALGAHHEMVRDTVNPARSHPYGSSHGGNLFEESLEVPLLVLNAGQSGTVRERVSTVDVVPTILDRVRASEATEQSLSGVPLGTELPERPIYAEGIGDGYQQRAVYWQGYKLIEQVADDVTLLFDLDDDPQERAPIEDGQVLSRLEEMLPSLAEESVEERIEVSEEAQRRLDDLGYSE